MTLNIYYSGVFNDVENVSINWTSAPADNELAGLNHPVSGLPQKNALIDRDAS
jgi:hypothetical protein